VVRSPLTPPVRIVLERGGGVRDFSLVWVTASFLFRSFPSFLLNLGGSLSLCRARVANRKKDVHAYRPFSFVFLFCASSPSCVFLGDVTDSSKRQEVNAYKRKLRKVKGTCHSQFLLVTVRLFVGKFNTERRRERQTDVDRCVRQSGLFGWWRGCVGLTKMETPHSTRLLRSFLCKRTWKAVRLFL